MPVQAILSDMEDIQQSIARVAPELDAIDASDLAPLNVDLVSATSIALGVADRVRSYRDRMAKLPEFDLANVDKLVDYAKATYGLYLDNQPPPAPAEAEALMREASDLRAKLLVWSVPLVAAKHFDEASVASIRSGSGNKDIPADLIQLVTLYRRSWAAVQAICGVTEQDLERAAALGPAVFAMLSRRDQSNEKPGADGSLRLRRAWTRLDRAYAQCRRAIAFLRFAEGDVDEIAPNLRRNPGVARGGRSTDTVQPAPAPAPSPTNGGGVAGGGIGGGGSPFVTPT